MKQLIESLQEGTMYLVKEKEQIANERDEYKKELEYLKDQIKNKNMSAEE